MPQATESLVACGAASVNMFGMTVLPACLIILGVVFALIAYQLK